MNENTVWLLMRLARCSRDPRPLEPDEQPVVLRGVYRDKAKAAALCEHCCDVLVPRQLDVLDPLTCEKPAGMEYPVCTHRDLTVAAAS